MNKQNIFEPGKNCWQETQACYSSPLIDCANYYRALHSSICKAEKQIIIVGWDIDSRIRLLHGEEEEQSEERARMRGVRQEVLGTLRTGKARAGAQRRAAVPVHHLQQGLHAGRQSQKARGRSACWREGEERARM